MQKNNGRPEIKNEDRTPELNKEAERGWREENEDRYRGTGMGMGMEKERKGGVKKPGKGGRPGKQIL